MTDPVLSIKDLHVSYRTQLHEFEALHAISLNVAPGGTHGIVGESGCGKSTLAAAMIGLLPTNGRVTAGEVLLDGDNILDLPEHELRKVRGRRIGMVFQDPLTSLNPTFKVSTQMINAQLAHAVVGVNRKDARHRAIEMLERVGIPDPEIRIDHYPHQFSGGMRQRIMIATMLLLKPAVLICDEATSALDVTLQAQILDMLKKLSKEEGTALVIISHDIGVISQMSDDVSVLYAGRTIESGPAQDVLLNPQHPYTRRLLASVPSRHRRDIGLSTIPGRVPSLAHLPTGCTFADRCYAAQDECRQAETPLVKTASGLARCLVEIRDAADAAGLAPTNAAHIPEVPTEVVRPPVAVPDEPLLTAHGIEVTFVGGRKNPLKRDRHVIRAVDGVDLTLRRGEIIGLVGESGSGKTTLGKSLLRLVPVNAGSIDFEGTDLLAIPRRAWRSQRRRIQMIFQEPYGSLSPRMRVRGLITEPYVINQIPAEDRYTADQLLELVGLSTEQADKYPHELSGGQARRVGIARALAMQPDLIIADEPTAGLDVSAAAAALNLLRDLRSRLSLSQLIITHDLNIVGFIADRVMVMHEGRIVEAGNTRDVLDNPQHAYTQHLLSSVLSVPTKVG